MLSTASLAGRRVRDNMRQDMDSMTGSPPRPALLSTPPPIDSSPEGEITSSPHQSGWGGWRSVMITLTGGHGNTNYLKRLENESGSEWWCGVCDWHTDTKELPEHSVCLQSASAASSVASRQPPRTLSLPDKSACNHIRVCQSVAARQETGKRATPTPINQDQLTGQDDMHTTATCPTSSQSPELRPVEVTNIK